MICCQLIGTIIRSGEVITGFTEHSHRIIAFKVRTNCTIIFNAWLITVVKRDTTSKLTSISSSARVWVVINSADSLEFRTPDGDWPTRRSLQRVDEQPEEPVHSFYPQGSAIITEIWASWNTTFSCKGVNSPKTSVLNTLKTWNRYDKRRRTQRSRKPKTDRNVSLTHYWTRKEESKTRVPCHKDGSSTYPWRHSAPRKRMY